MYAAGVLVRSAVVLRSLCPSCQVVYCTLKLIIVPITAPGHNSYTVSCLIQCCTAVIVPQALNNHLRTNMPNKNKPKLHLPLWPQVDSVSVYIVSSNTHS